ncbi:MAG: EAL domain-containing protein [Sinobacteraceae bacterium]|nr:EAL domain-containing protein [Nevskiaceae bacterium]
MTVPQLLTGEAPTPESLGAQLRAALPPMRVQSISLYDERANVLWLNEGALGPDEHNAVTEAMGALSRDVALSCYESRLEDGRTALVLPSRSPQGTTVGVAMILADSKSVSDNVSERLANAQIRAILQRLAVLLRPASARTGTGRVLQLPPEVNIPVLSAASVQPPPAQAAAGRFGSAQRPATTAAEEVPVLTSEGVDDVLEFDLSPEIADISRPAVPVPPVTTAPAPAAALPASSEAIPAPPKVATAPAGTAGEPRLLCLPEGMTVTLELQQFVSMRAGGRSRRFEVQPRISYKDNDRAPPGLEKYVLQQLLTWMEANRRAWTTEPTSFTLSLSATMLEDERFPQFIATNLRSHSIAGESIGFEITEALCMQRRVQVERFFELCEKLGCFVVIDDFSLDSSIVTLLRSRALRLVKIDPRFTSVALKDKLAQAMVAAIAQAVKVLGIHCAAKRVDSKPALQWLAAIGCDLAQGTAAAAPQTLETLAAPAG